MTPSDNVKDNKITEQVNLFNYLRNISYERELDIDNKLRNLFDNYR